MMRKTVAQGYVFLSETGVSQKSCGLSSLSTSKFPFWGIFIPSDHIDAAYSIAYNVLDIIYIS